MRENNQDQLSQYFEEFFRQIGEDKFGPLEPILPGDVVLDQTTWLSALRLYRYGLNDRPYSKYQNFLLSDILSLVHLLEALVCYDRLFLVGASEVWGGPYTRLEEPGRAGTLPHFWHPLQFLPTDILNIVFPLPMRRMDYLNLVQSTAEDAVKGKFAEQIGHFLKYYSELDQKARFFYEVARIPDSPDKDLNAYVLEAFSDRFPEHRKIIPLLDDKFGKDHDDEDIDIERVRRKIAYAIAYRTEFYLRIHENLKIPYVGHPYRASYLSITKLLERQKTHASDAIKYDVVLNEVLNTLTSDALGKEDFDNELFGIPFPPVFEFILSESSTADDLIRIAFQIRNSTSAKQFRDWLKTSTNRLGIKRLKFEINELMTAFRKELGIETQKELSATAVIGPIELNNLNLKLPTFFNRIYFFPWEKHKTFLRSLWHSVARAENSLSRVEELFLNTPPTIIQTIQIPNRLLSSLKSETLDFWGLSPKS